jgi:hypothetical protein
MPNEPFFNEDQQAVLELATNLMEQSARSTQFLTNSLMEGYQEDAKKARAELKAVRIQITDLFADGFMPTEGRIIDALIPDPKLVERLMESRWI